MAIAEELVAGVISSVLAVLLVEIYLWLRRRYRQRALRWLVGTDTAAVVTPVYPWVDQGHPAGLLTTYDAIGLAHVLEACYRVGTVPVVSRSGESAENAPLDVIAIGGPSGNQVTATFLKAYCPGFEILTDPETGKLSYRCGGRVFARTDDETFAFIVRLSPKETGLPGTALITWGHSAVSTASAGYYVAKYPQALRKVGKGSFFVAISVRWVLGYRSFDTRPIDLTKAAFSPPPSVSPSLVSSRSVSSSPVCSPPAPVEPVDEPAPRRRFGRSSGSSGTARSSEASGTGRSRVAEALDDVRAAESSSVATAPPGTPPGDSSAGGPAPATTPSEPVSSEPVPSDAASPSKSSRGTSSRGTSSRASSTRRASSSAEPPAADPDTPK